MFKCYDSSKLRNEILICDQCNAPFNEYDETRFTIVFRKLILVSIGLRAVPNADRQINHLS